MNSNAKKRKGKSGGRSKENLPARNSLDKYFKKQQSEPNPESQILGEVLKDRSKTANPIVITLANPESSLIPIEPVPSTSSSAVEEMEVDQEQDATVGLASREQSVDRESSSSPLPPGCYEVEEIQDYHDGFYHIKWKGYGLAENTWEVYENVSGCKDLLVSFYLKRKAEFDNQTQQRSEFKGQKRKKLNANDVPPDPRSLEEQAEHYLTEKGITFSENEIETAFKASAKKVWTHEKLANQLKLSNNVEKLRTQLLYFIAENKAAKNQTQLENWCKELNQISSKMPIITVENKADLSGPPKGFTYINDYLPRGLTIPDDPPVGCNCKENCTAYSETKLACCPAMQEGTSTPSYYSKSGKLRAVRGTPIYECNKKCLCTSSCPNRVVQDGISSIKGREYCIFRTDNGCGWGLKTLKPIQKGTFVCLYVGEIIDTEEAERRGKEYDEAGSTYLFDLDFNELNDDDDCPYTVDAAKYGNVSHFINHSCDPNLAIYGVWSDCLDPNLPKLALFALVDIPKNTELNFDYQRKTVSNSQSREREDLPLISKTKCKCGSRICRDYFF